MLGALPVLVTIKLFASASLPSEVAFLKRDVDDLLGDYRGAGRGMVRVAVRDPSADTAALREARQLGIPAVQFNVLGRSELQVKEGYLGVAVQYAEGVKTIPFVQEGGDLEYRLTSEIRALTHRERPVVGVSETSDATSVRARRSFDALQEQLGRTYTARPLTLGDSAIAEDVKVLVLIGAPDSLRGRQQERLEQFLRRGGGALVMASGMALNPGTPVAYARPVAWNRVLKPYGVQIHSDMAFDLASNERIAVPAQFGQVLVSYPLWLRALSTKASPVNAQLNAVLLPWASTIDTTGAAPGSVTPLLATSRAGGLQEVTAFLTPAREFPRDSLARRLLAVQVNPLARDTAPPLRGRLVVVGSADFASDRYAGNSPENVVFALNAVDWLAQDDALIAIRSKNRAPAPLVFTSGTKRDAVKYGNMIGIPLLLVAAAAARLWRRRLITRRPYRPLGAALVELITGQNGPAFGTLYVRKPGDTRVFLWRGRSLPGPTNRVDDWRDKRIAGVEPDSVRALEIARGKERYALERRDRRWTLAGRGPADSAAVTRLLEHYRSLAAVGFATPQQADSLRARRPSRRATLRGPGGRVLLALAFDSTASGTWG